MRGPLNECGLSYEVACAVGPDTTVSFTDASGTSYAWTGALNLAPEWLTGAMSPDGVLVMQERSNIPAIAEYCFRKEDPEFVSRAKQWGGGFIVAADNYGQGSSREHAALAASSALVRMDLDDRLPLIGAPTLIVTTQESGLQSVEAVERYAARIRDARVIVVAGDSYHIAAVEPDLCAQHALRFMQEVAARKGPLPKVAG